MKTLKNIIQEGILSDIDVTLDSTDKMAKKLSALNIKASSFEEFVSAFADYFGCKVPNIKKKSGKLYNSGRKGISVKVDICPYTNSKVADIKISKITDSTHRVLYSLKFVQYLEGSRGYFLQLKKTYISMPFPGAGSKQTFRTEVNALYKFYNSEESIKDFISSIKKDTSAYDELFDKKDFN